MDIISILEEFNLFMLTTNLMNFTKDLYVAHELGHAVEHTKKNTAYLSKHTLFSTDKLEREANTFAVELLVQDMELYQHIKSGYNLDQIASIFGIPKQFMKYKSL